MLLENITGSFLEWHELDAMREGWVRASTDLF